MSDRWRGASEDDAVRKLLEDAGPRPVLPVEDLRAIRSAAREEWVRRYGAVPERRRPQRSWLAAAAALLVVGIGVAWWIGQRSPAVSPTVGSVERVVGALPWKVGAPLEAGSVLATDGAEPGRLTLRMLGGASVRLDFATEVKLSSATMVELRRGAVYVDTGAAPKRGGEVSVSAASALFRPTGTQFQVRVGGRNAKLQVREGRVAVNRGTRSIVAEAGDEVVVGRNGTVVRRPGTLSGPDWAWVGETAPIFAIEGVKARDFLDWYGRESGLRVELADGEAAAVADSCVLHGSIEQLSLTDAPAVVLSSCGLDHRISNGTLVVSVAAK